MVKHWPISVGATVRKWILDKNSEDGEGESAMLTMLLFKSSLFVVVGITEDDLGTIIILTGLLFSTCLFR